MLELEMVHAIGKEETSAVGVMLTYLLIEKASKIPFSTNRLTPPPPLLKTSIKMYFFLYLAAFFTAVIKHPIFRRQLLTAFLYYVG